MRTETFYFISRNLTNKQIPLIGTAPHYILARDHIPLQDSDTHTIALAEFYGAKRVILIKRTDGIYDFDPYRGFVFDTATRGCADFNRWHDHQQDNKRHATVTIDKLLKGRITREGSSVHDGTADGSKGHLMEDSALEYLRNCSHVEELLVVHIAPDEMYFSSGRHDRAIHIITGDELSFNPRAGYHDIGGQSPHKQELALLREDIRNAILEGKTQSRIMRN